MYQIIYSISVTANLDMTGVQKTIHIHTHISKYEIEPSIP